MNRPRKLHPISLLPRRADVGAGMANVLAALLVFGILLLPCTLLAAGPIATASITTAPCRVSQVDMPRLERALARLARRPASRQPSRLWALLPAKISGVGRQSVNTGAGLYVDDTRSNVRWLAGDRRGWTVRLSWNLQTLWRERPNRRIPLLAHALLVDRVAARVAATLGDIGRARAKAAGYVADEPRCTKVQTDAQAAVLRLRALLAASGDVRGDVKDGTKRRNPALRQKSVEQHTQKNVAPKTAQPSPSAPSAQRPKAPQRLAQDHPPSRCRAHAKSGRCGGR